MRVNPAVALHEVWFLTLSPGCECARRRPIEVRLNVLDWLAKGSIEGLRRISAVAFGMCIPDSVPLVYRPATRRQLLGTALKLMELMVK